MNDDKTRIRQDANDDRTSVRGNPSDAGDGATSESEETVIRDPGQPPPPKARVLSEPAPAEDKAANSSGPSEDSATVIREPASDAAAPEEATVLKQDAVPDSEDATLLNVSRDEDSTVLSDSARGRVDTTYVASEVGHSRSRGNSEAGRLLKNRFVLEERVGSGGMGDVYKALDLRQQEAQERNPYIAIKILNENFARHKDAFISLQREATRTRGIPHPNIMAVYDFDREGDTVFMSMELLDGKPLDDYLKEHPEGVSVEDAWNIIDGICQGLSRAHGAGIVHSDFKPGNIYYTEDKLAKVFDFGIARAVSSPEEIQSDGEKTVFDAGSLGALTPTYASLEMLTGKEPTTSDDVYAVALVAYELFTGRHPYSRTPADKALEKGLEPEPISFLKRRHWRALKKGLALRAEDRYQTIDEFYEGMFSEDLPYFRYGAIAAVLLLSLGFGAFSYFNVQEVPVELTELQGRLSADKENLKSRIGDLGKAFEPSKWNFESEDWREEVRLSLSRIRGVDLQLRENWQQSPDPDVDSWKQRVLQAYLTEIRGIRERVATVDVKLQGTLEEQEAVARSALDDLLKAKSYLDIAERDFNFDSKAIFDERSLISQAIQFRQFQHDSVVADIKEKADRAAVAEAERIARAQTEQARAQRNATYQELVNDFKDILRCKGDISDQDVARLGAIINGQHGLKAVFPAQFAIDKPGMVFALKGCIEQRIGVRAPARARMIKAKVMTYLPGERQLASIVIDDLDPCAARSLEGNGVRNGSWCSDRLAAGGNGPEMVVIPPKESGGKRFAISRIEIKVSDYNQFCESTGCAKVPGLGTIPVTNISLKQAQAYARWLSDQTGHQYRLPTPEEWLYAAKTDVSEPLDDNINCTVDSRGVRLGEKLLSTLSGRPNHWGLYNFVGNAREWAVSNDKVYALGGAHTDPKSECNLKKSVDHSGDPDPITGFRILRQIEG